ncbi:MAG: C39 family peptidase [Proteobacteria bacterium]|nr:C39 family peptidase [Pseudomonadota bacterium]
MTLSVYRPIRIVFFFFVVTLGSMTFSNENALAMQPYESIGKNPKGFLVNQGPAMCAPTAFYMIFKYYGDCYKKPPFFYDEKGNVIDLYETGDDFTSNNKRLAKGAKIAQWINPQGGATDWRKLKKGAEDLFFKSDPKGAMVRYYQTIDSNDTLIKTGKKNEKTKKDLMEKRILPLLEKNQPVLVHLSRKYASGHYMVVIGYDKKSETVYYVDPNEKDMNAILRKIGYNEFANTNWYEGHVPKLWGKAIWSGKFLSFGPKK